MKELDTPKDSASQLEVGDFWWDLSQQEEGEIQESMQQRATFWYREAMPSLKGLARLKVEKRIASAEITLDTPKPSGRPTSRRPSKATLLRMKHAPDAVEFNGHYYKVVFVSMPWQNAVKACESVGGYLACLETQEEQDKVAELKGNGKVVWVGGYRKDGEVKWINGGDIPDDRFFEKRDGHDFVAFITGAQLTTRKADGTLRPANVEKIQGFVCEWDE